MSGAALSRSLLVRHTAPWWSCRRQQVGKKCSVNLKQPTTSKVFHLVFASPYLTTRPVGSNPHSPTQQFGPVRSVWVRTTHTETQHRCFSSLIQRSHNLQSPFLCVSTERRTRSKAVQHSLSCRPRPPHERVGGPALPTLRPVFRKKSLPRLLTTWVAGPSPESASSKRLEEVPRHPRE